MIKNPRFGFHYFPDTLHYRQADLSVWLPELAGLGASWLTLQAPAERAIPEVFINALLTSGIQPILHFNLPLGKPVDLDALRLLLRSYASWGVGHVILFDRPNLRSAWPSAAWLQAELVERFLDYYLPLADLVQAHDMVCIFPPLIPGGDYWDLSYLASALHSLKRRQPARWLDKFALAAYAGSADRPLDWGAGGLQRWPGARPYISQPGIQDQRGLHIHEWYQPVCMAELGRTIPMYLLGMGCYPGDAPGYPGEPSTEMFDGSLQAQRSMEILSLLAIPSGKQANPVFPDEVQAACFWLLADEPQSNFARQGWYQMGPEGWQPGLLAKRARAWAAGEHRITENKTPARQAGAPAAERPILHYVLLPLYAWGAPQLDLARLSPLVEGCHPTIGFSLEEACLASNVTLVGGSGAFSPQTIEFLRQAGCTVELFQEAAGTQIATNEPDNIIPSQPVER